MLTSTPYLQYQSLTTCVVVLNFIYKEMWKWAIFVSHVLCSINLSPFQIILFTYLNPWRYTGLQFFQEEENLMRQYPFDKLGANSSDMSWNFCRQFQIQIWTYLDECSRCLTWFWITICMSNRVIRTYI